MKFNVTTLLVLIGLAASLGHPVHAEEPNSGERLAIELLHESRAIENVTTLMKDQLKLGFIKALNKKSKKISKKNADKALSIVEKTFEERIPELIKPMAKLYSDAFTDEELKAIIAFQKSPAGRKASKLMPSLVQRGMVLGSKWGQNIGKIAVERVKTEFKKDGVDI